MSETRVRGRYRRQPAQVGSPRGARPQTFERAEDCIYPMPTVEEVVKAGYPASFWDKVKRDRDEFIQKFNADPTFREEAKKRARERKDRP